MNIKHISSPVSHHRDVVILVRPGRFIHEISSCSRTSSEIGESRKNLLCEMLEQSGIPVFSRLEDVTKADVPAASVVGIVSRENIHKGINRYIVNIPRAMCINFHLAAVRTYSADSASQHRQFSPVCPFSLVEAIISCCNIYPAVYPHADSVGSMVGTSFP